MMAAGEGGGDRLLSRIRGSLGSRLLTTSSHAFLVLLVSAGVGFLVQLGTVRLIGTESFGAFAYVVAWTTVLGYIATLGFHISLLKFLRYLREELLIVLGTASSDSVLPQIMRNPARAHVLPIVWTGRLLAAARTILGVSVELRGTPPQGDVIVAAKHQSFLDILAISHAVPQCGFIMKREVMRVPVMGYYARRAGCIPIDRARGGEAGGEGVGSPAVELPAAADVAVVVSARDEVREGELVDRVDGELLSPSGFDNGIDQLFGQSEPAQPQRR